MTKCSRMYADGKPCTNTAFARCAKCDKQLCSEHIAIGNHYCHKAQKSKQEPVSEGLSKHIRKQFREVWGEMSDCFRLDATNYTHIERFAKWFERGYIRGMKHEQHRED